MFDIALRRWKDILTDPFARMVPRWVSPNQITLLAFLCGIISCFAATRPQFHTVTLALWLLNRMLDCLDGSVARHRKIASSLGGFWDLLSDFVVYSLLPIAIAIGQGRALEENKPDWLAISLLEASFHVNNFILFYSAAVAAQRHDDELTSVTMRPALVEGFESGLLFTAMLLWPRHIKMLAWLMAGAVSIGIVQRTIAVSLILKKNDAGPKSK